jgi:hypothetical protein
MLWPIICRLFLLLLLLLLLFYFFIFFFLKKKKKVLWNKYSCYHYYFFHNFSSSCTGVRNKLLDDEHWRCVCGKEDIRIDSIIPNESLRASVVSYKAAQTTQGRPVPQVAPLVAAPVMFATTTSCRLILVIVSDNWIDVASLMLEHLWPISTGSSLAPRSHVHGSWGFHNRQIFSVIC